MKRVFGVLTISLLVVAGSVGVAFSETDKLVLNKDYWLSMKWPEFESSEIYLEMEDDHERTDKPHRVFLKWGSVNIFGHPGLAFITKASTLDRADFAYEVHFELDAVEIVNQTELCKLTRERIQNVYGAPDGELDVSFKTGVLAILDKSIGWNIGSTRLHLKCSGIGRSTWIFISFENIQYVRPIKDIVWIKCKLDWGNLSQNSELIFGVNDFEQILHRPNNTKYAYPYQIILYSEDAIRTVKEQDATDDYGKSVVELSINRVTGKIFIKITGENPDTLSEADGSCERTTLSQPKF